MIGAGKTTLLNYISGRNAGVRNLLKTGNILINGKNTVNMQVSLSQLCAFVQQDDVLFQTLTVRECLEFSAKLRLTGTFAEKMQRVDKIIRELNLKKCENTKIGGELFKGVSGGERKRTSIGVELITNPSLIFLDEPTTGLDSFTAFNVFETLKDLAHHGRTIITTIHQPSSDIFENFDRLLLLAKGKIIYLNEARLAVDYFASLGKNYACPEFNNPADFFMDMLSIDSIDTDVCDTALVKTKQEVEEEFEQRINYLESNYQRSSLKNDCAYMSPDIK